MPDNDSPQPTLTLTQFLIGAALFEGGILVIAFILGALVGLNPTAELHWIGRDFLLGLIATVPMLLMLAACWLSKLRGLVQIRQFLCEVLGPMLSNCRLIDIFFLALLAGVCEEVLFRGLVYEFIEDWNPTLAVMVSNVLFGLAHAVTPLYAWLAGFIGLYLTALLSVDSSPNLLIPITAHTAYDFIGFLLVRWDYRRNQRLKQQLEQRRHSVDSTEPPTPDYEAD